MTTEHSEASTPWAQRQSWTYVVTWFVGALPVFVDSSLWPVPVLAMVVYLVLGRAAAEKHGEIFEFADSFYYLGFALSMSSLLASLEPFGSEIAAPSPQEIMHRFGLGMFTTLLGVVGRTGLQLFYRLPQESLEATNRRIQEEATQYLEELVVLRRRAGQEAAEQLELLQSSRAQLARIAHEQLDASRANAEVLNEERSSLAAEVRGLGRTMTTVARSMERTEEAFQGLTRRLEALGAAVHGDRTALGDSTGEPRSLVASLAALQRQVDALGGSFVLDTTGAQTAVTAFRDAVSVASSQVRDQLGASREIVEGLAGRLATVGVGPLENAVRSLGSQLQGVAAGLTTDGTRIREGALRDLEQSLQEAAREARSFNALLDEIASALTSRLETIR